MTRFAGRWGRFRRKNYGFKICGDKKSGTIVQYRNKGNKKENVPLNVVIPYYQRPYKWDSTRIGNLITDFHNNEEGEAEDGEGYFAGSVVMVEGRNGEFEVVDGQQRITTLF